MITVIDYGMGNIRSVVKAVELFTGDVIVSSDPSSIKNSRALIMPGDGAFGKAMENLRARGWIAPLLEFIERGGFFFGICLGFQLLFESSEEFGFNEGMKIIPGRVVRFRPGALKVPHMGWNNFMLRNKSKFLAGIPDNSYFYFIHSYYPVTGDRSWILGEAEYSCVFPCIVGKNNLIATQFHPEKSHRLGIRIIENFVRESQQ